MDFDKKYLLLGYRIENRIYFDACTCIDSLQKTQEHYQYLESILQLAEAGKLVILTSTLTWFEARRFKNDEGEDQTYRQCDKDDY